jgi:glycosyltransferase involved in cell wall biosynthesis
MEIVIPVTGFGRQGGYRVLSNLANEWVKLGHTVRFLCPKESDAPYFPTTAEIIWLDRAGKSVPAHERLTHLERYRLWNALGSLFGGLQRYAKSADVVMANQSMTAWPVSLARLKARKFYYVQAYEPEYYRLLPGLQMPILQLLSYCSYMLPLKQIVNAPVYLLYKTLRAHLSVPPGIDFALFYPGEKQDRCHRQLAIGCIGRPDLPFKGTKYVYDAFHILSQRGIRVELRVAFGKVDDEPDPNVHIVIPKNDKELGDYYRSLDILIAPGTVQLGAAHYPVMEAMACGVAVVTTGYLPASNRNSWIVPVYDASAIADAVTEIMANPDEEMRRVAQAANDIQPFTWNSAAVSMLRGFNDTASFAIRPLAI